MADITATMDDRATAVRSGADGWTPRRATYPKVFVWPPNPRGIARWLFGWQGFFVPWNAVYFGVPLLLWWFATPSWSTMRSFSPGWVAQVLVRNIAVVLVWFGAFHLDLYSRRRQGTHYKFNAAWPGSKSRLFTFGNQLRDNLFWSLASGVPIWTAYEVVTYWMFANGHLHWLRFSTNPVWFVALFLLIPLFREVHFYAVHRLIHARSLYPLVHKLHHRNTNPGPFSGLSMHPAEHALYFSGILVHWIVPSHPFHAMFHIFHAGISPAPGHTGFERVELAGGVGIETNSLAHYLHHKHFEVNYADGALPLDRWFGSFHDGSPEGDALLRKRLSARAARRASSSKPAPVS